MNFLFVVLVCVVLIALIIIALLGFSWLAMVMVTNMVSFYKEWKNPTVIDRYLK